MKQLVTATTIEQFLTTHKDVFPVTKDTLITPSAADFAKSHNIKFVADGEMKVKDRNNVLASFHTSEHSDSVAQNAKHSACAECEAKAEEAPAEAAPAEEPAKEISVANFTKDQIVEAVIRVLDAKGILDKILEN
jgi:ethanolamine utilization cobalamin adenosyltransferase